MNEDVRNMIMCVAAAAFAFLAVALFVQSDNIWRWFRPMQPIADTPACVAYANAVNEGIGYTYGLPESCSRSVSEVQP